MKILGLSFGYHDSSAALIDDGIFIAGSHEERFSRKKHDNTFPQKSIDFCLNQSGCGMNDIDHIVYYERPDIKFGRIIQMSSENENSAFAADRFFEWVRTDSFDIKGYIASKLSFDRAKIVYVGHHEAHAAAAYYPSVFDRAAVLTLDGVGEWDTLCIYSGENEKLTPVQKQKLPDSLGLFYAAMTSFLGFEVNEGEYKVMGMAAYGNPAYKNEVGKLISFNEGYIEVNMDFFNFGLSEERMYTDRLPELFGEPRVPESPFFTEDYMEYAPEGYSPEEISEMSVRNRKYADIAASLQHVAEEIIISMAKHAMTLCKTRNLCLSGGVALNSKANGRIRKELDLSGFFVQPSAGDSGSALGAALYFWHNVLGRIERSPMMDAYKGRSYDESKQQILSGCCGNERISVTENISELVHFTAQKIAEGKVIGWFCGRSEWGPRALGGRSILADPRYEETKLTVNRKIKYREPFRPFAPSVLAEYAHEWFHLPRGLKPNDPESYMLTTVRIRDEKHGRINAVVHHDGTSRIQLVHKSVNPEYHALISEFYRLTGVPMLLNTSFNLKGEPVVETPLDALITFSYSYMDYLVMNPYILKAYGDETDEPAFRHAEDNSGQPHFMHAGNPFSGSYFPYLAYETAGNSDETSAFGFRVPVDYKELANRDNDCKLVAFFGGTKCYDPSSSCGNRFSDILEKMLNEYGKHTYKVLNFGTQNSVITDQIMIYLLFAYALHPDITVHYGGTEDLEAAAFCDRHLVAKDAVIYPENARKTAEIIHGSGNRESVPNGLSHEDLIKAYKEREKQFEKTVLGNGGKFISIQDSETGADFIYTQLKAAVEDL